MSLLVAGETASVSLALMVATDDTSLGPQKTSGTSRYCAACDMNTCLGLIPVSRRERGGY